jgi:hypothetical protein
MGPMKDPMAGNGRQLWQRFAWLENPPRLVDETRAGESGEGLMETVAFHPTVPVFLMGGRLRGGEWNVAFFAAADGTRRQQLNTGFRVTSSLFPSDGQTLVLAGTDKQSPPKDGQYPAYGIVEAYAITSS